MALIKMFWYECDRCRSTIPDGTGATSTKDADKVTKAKGWKWVISISQYDPAWIYCPTCYAFRGDKPWEPDERDKWT